MSTDGASHIHPDFREAFPTWTDLRHHLEAATGSHFGLDRALHQLLSADLAMRMEQARPHDWMLLGSLSLPARVSVEPARWPGNLQELADPGVEPPYVMARSAFDLDLCALDVVHRDPQEMARLYGHEMLAAVRAVSVSQHAGASPEGVGLGGLVRYRSDDLKVFPNGQVMGIVTAEPIDPRLGPIHSPVTDDPVGIEIDIKPPNKVQFDGKPDRSQRSVLGVDLPGFAEWRPALFPTENQLADKVSLLTGPVFTMREAPTGHWHRYKDLLDAYFIVSTCHLDADRLRSAVGTNWNLERIGRDALPVPYRVYGDGKRPDEPSVPWDEGCDNLRQSQPQLGHYPTFREMVASVGACLDGVASAGRGAVWAIDRSWHRPPALGGRSAVDIAALGFPSRPQARPSKAAPGSGPPAAPPPGPSVDRRDSGFDR